MKEKGWEQVTDTGAIKAWVEAVLAENPDPVSQIKDGNMKPLGFLVGQVMKRATGQADPKEVNRWDQPNRLGAKAIPAPAVNDGRVTLSLPPLSFTALSTYTA